ncbi:hypothetical protein RRG08_037227 [Elysia crispata]|uniref:Integral membrane protein 2 n=1 Tax=Elysia crispata TaxID=231223 RepID=A0AAE1A0V2_9GAST|nr:hypothetical protein RRG08_037227 [Elysia crispata]
MKKLLVSGDSQWDTLSHTFSVIDLSSSPKTTSLVPLPSFSVQNKMTIYTPQADKKSANDVEPEVVTEPLTGEKKDKEALDADIIDNHYNDGRAVLLRAKRRSTFMHMLLALIILGVLALGAIGSIVLYRHLNKKIYTGRCGNEFYDVVFHDGLEAPQDEGQNDYVCEEITVNPEEKYEELHTPRFDEVRETFVLHDFVVNYSAIIDHELRRCYITKIKSNILRPDDFVFQIQEDTSFGSVLHTVVFREDYVMVIPDRFTRPIGKRIMEACFHYDTFKLELYVDNMMKRSLSGLAKKHTLDEPVATYAIFTNNATQQNLYKIRVHEPKKLP